METKAVLIVCNDPGRRIDMRGSGDDVTRMYNYLIEEYGFSEDDITVLVDTDHSAAATAEPKSECHKLERKLDKKEKKGKHIERLTLEKDDAVQLAKRQVEKISKKLAVARKDAEIAENERIKMQTELERKEELVKSLKLKCQEVRLRARRKVEKIRQELVDAPKNDDIAENERIKVKTELEQMEELVKSLKLKCQEIRQSGKRKVEKIHQELVNAQKNADILENKWIKVNEELQEKLELVQLLQLKCDESRQSAMREVEEKQLEFASILDAAVNAASSSVVAEPCAICLINEKNMAFGCGHMTCNDCGVNEDLSKCPICRKEITHRIKLFLG